MQIQIVHKQQDLEKAAGLAAAHHEDLRRVLPFLPPRDAAHFRPKIAWMAREGDLFGLRLEGELQAFLGGFVLENFRNAGRGAFCPDWSHGSALGARSFEAYRALYREMAPLWKAKGAHIHAIGLYASDAESIEAFSMTGFGRIMMDAARPVEDLLAELANGVEGGCQTLRATEADASVLAALNADLAAHIGASPILMPGTFGMSETAWRDWFAEPEAIAYLSTSGGDVTGYIKAQGPQIDVTNAVHGAQTLAINGAFVTPRQRGLGTGKALLLALARQAREMGKDLLSVDCETMNPEAYAFWSHGFRPVAWGLERRT